MFRSAQNLRLAADMRALQRVAAPWRQARTTWFDGTPESLEARLAATERVLTYARGGMTAAHVALEREASIARAELKEAAHRLMVDFLDDGARAFKGSKRVASASGEAQYELNQWLADKFGDREPSADEHIRARKEFFADRPLHKKVIDNDLHDWPWHEGSRRVAGDGPGTPGNPTADDIWEAEHWGPARRAEESRAKANQGFLEEMAPEDRPGYGEGNSAECRHCGETINDYGNGYQHYDGVDLYTGDDLPYDAGHPAVPDDPDYDDEGNIRESSRRSAKGRGLRECINCGGALSGEEDDDKDSECGTCGKSAHEKDVDWRKKGHRLAVSWGGMEAPDDECLNCGLGIDFDENPDLEVCPACGEHPIYTSNPYHVDGS